MKPMIKKALLSLLALVILLTGVLVIHIYMVTQKPVYDNAHIQMSRIDLTQPLDSINRATFTSNAKPIKAINRYVINDNNILITYDNRSINAMELHEKLSRNMTTTSKLYIPSAKNLENSCPVMDKQSFSYKFGKWIEKVF